MAEPTNRLRVKLDLVGKGSLGADGVAALRSFVKERGNGKGYGFAFDYRGGELLVEVETERLEDDALGAEPVERFEGDLRALLGLLAPRLGVEMKASLAIEQDGTRILHRYRHAGKGELSKETIVGPGQAQGSTSETRRSSALWSNPKFVLPVLVVIALAFILLHYFGLFPLTRR